MTQPSPTKTQFYSANGAGRDSYIYANNGGFCPRKEPCKVQELGKYASEACYAVCFEKSETAFYDEAQNRLLF